MDVCAVWMCMLMFVVCVWCVYMFMCVWVYNGVNVCAVGICVCSCVCMVPMLYVCVYMCVCVYVVCV